MTTSTATMPTTIVSAPAILGTTRPRKSLTEVTSPSTRWISSPGVWRRWNSWSRPSTWRAMSMRIWLVVRQAVVVANQATTTRMAWVAMAMARNTSASEVIRPRCRRRRRRPASAVAMSTMRRTTSGPARVSAEPGPRARRGRPNAERRAAGGRRGRANATWGRSSGQSHGSGRPVAHRFSGARPAGKSPPYARLAFTSGGDSIAPWPSWAWACPGTTRQSWPLYW